ncbi:sulfate adenylyltransferase subunit 2 [Striga asiatica]|uniref:Sulfate adenylyltransferase subunit 2 n=1 Tax=Striga asiatica TaxID=4170 RepID=A0A5A7QWS1_STRAF|nr:sulfate adenylyltransferase subunit 2 [Striga asiatica]
MDFSLKSGFTYLSPKWWKTEGLVDLVSIPSANLLSPTSSLLIRFLGILVGYYDWLKTFSDKEVVVCGGVIPNNMDEWNILTWWKLNGSNYSNLQNLAKDVLAIQVSTLISISKRVIDPHS